MSDLSKIIHNRWERFLLGSVTGLLCTYLGIVAFNVLNPNDETQVEKPRTKSLRYLFNINDKSFAEPKKLSPNINPMKFEVSVSLPPAKPNLKKPTPQKPTSQKPTPQKPAPQKPTAQKPTPQKPTPQKPQPPARKITVNYRGFVAGNSSQVAFYSAVDSKGKKTEAKAAKNGAMIHGILKIKSFDGNKIILLLGNQEITVKRGKPQDFIIK